MMIYSYYRFLSNTKSHYSAKILIACAVIFAILCACAPPSDKENSRPITDHVLEEKWIGDFDGMVKRKKIRVLVALNKMLFFFDGPRMRGISVDGFVEFEKYINKKLQSKNIKVQIIFIPTSRDNLLPALIEGYGDIVAANLTITDEREKIVDFTDPFLTNVNEVVITGPKVKTIKTIDDLSGNKIFVRPSSSYFENLNKINNEFRKKDKKKIKIVKADEYLEDSDLLEMVNANMISTTVVDSHKAHFWAEIFNQIQVHYDITVNTDGKIAWAIRKNSPKLKAVTNEFVKDHKVGTLHGNILFKRYLKENKWVRESLAEEHLKKFEKTVVLFKKYGEQYDFDWLILAALGYQESQLDQSKRSGRGAVGIMQILPSTAEDKNVNVKNINKLENNIHAGTKYLRFIQDRYFSDEAISEKNRYLFSLAAYNAGPAKVARLRREASESGLDPNIWFGNVEVIAAKRIGRETVQYVSNIYKYYIAYSLSADQFKAKQKRT